MLQYKNYPRLFIASRPKWPRWKAKASRMERRWHTSSCGGHFSQENRNILFLRRNKKQFYCHWPPCVRHFVPSLHYTHAFHTWSHLSSGHLPELGFTSLTQSETCLVGTQDATAWPNEGLLFSLTIRAGKVPLTGLALHGCLWINEWTTEWGNSRNWTPVHWLPNPSSWSIALPATLRACSQQSCLSWPET